MTDVLSRYNSGKLWDFDGGIHPPEMKSQSNQTPITIAPLAQDFFVPVKQHAGSAGNILVKVGDKVLKGQPLTQGENLRALPVHAPTSGTVKAIAPVVAAHPSGLSELAIHIQADGLDQWRTQNPIDDFLQLTPEQLIDKIYQAGIAGLGGAIFPTAAKVNSAQNKVKLLIINGAECEPYITCDDRLMRDYADEIIEGCRILRYILRPEKIVIAIEDNKPEAVNALEQALYGSDDIDIRVIPTKYPSGAAKQLIQILTGMEVPHGQRSSSIGVLMQNVGTVFAIKRAVINDEPLIERVVTLTGDKIPHKGNQWVRFGTPIQFVLENAGYQADDRFPVFVGGPMMGLMVPNLQAPITKTANCLLAPDHFEYDPLATEQSCIRCSACSDACPVHLMPQQMYWYSRAEDHDNAQKQNIMDCIECGLCAYVCPSHIPLIQYFRQEKAQIWDIAQKAKKAEEAKIRFEARQARLEQEAKERQARSQRAAAARRDEIAASQGEDPVKAALERLKAKKAGEASSINATAKIKTILSESGETLPDNSALMAQRKARRLARQQETETTEKNPTALDPKKAAVAAALARAKAKKAAQQTSTVTASAVENVEVSVAESTEQDPKKAAVAAAIARAKAKKAAQQVSTVTASAVENVEVSVAESTEQDPKKAAVAAAIARAKAKKAAQQTSTVTASAVENVEVSVAESTEQDPKKAAVAAAIARAKAKKAAQQVSTVTASAVENMEVSVAESAEQELKKAAVAAAITRAKAKKAAQQVSTVTASAVENMEVSVAESAEQDPKKAAVAAAIARAKAKKAALQLEKEQSQQSS